MPSPSKKLFSRSRESQSPTTKDAVANVTPARHARTEIGGPTPLAPSASPGANEERNSRSPVATTTKRSNPWTQASFSSQIPELDATAFPRPSPVPKKPRIDPAAVSSGNECAVAPARTGGHMPPPATAPRRQRVLRLPAESLSQGLGAHAAQPSPQSTQAYDARTPVATQLFEPDDPQTATQEAFLADGYEMPSPPPFFAASEARQDPVDVRSTQEKAALWAESARLFFKQIDERRIIDVDR